VCLKKKIITRILIIFLSIISISTALSQTHDSVSASDIYRYFWGAKDNYQFWIVDGANIRRLIFDEFIYGGNPERYTFVPDGEIWIDNSISSDEFTYTLLHEINECNLMAKYGMAYFDAHDSSLSLELQMRRKNLYESLIHEVNIPEVAPTDFDSTQEIENLPDKIKLKNIYIYKYDTRNGIDIWVVNGYNVRRDVYPDFGFSGNDLAYHFIPENEIWIDGSISCEEIEYSISLELKEKSLLFNGLYYDDAYEKAKMDSNLLRNNNYKVINSKNFLHFQSPLYRDKGRGFEFQLKK
jgi:hypothetical protein